MNLKVNGSEILANRCLIDSPNPLTQPYKAAHSLICDGNVPKRARKRSEKRDAES